MQIDLEAMPRFVRALQAGDNSLALQLAKDGLDVNARTDWGGTPLHMASALGCAEVVRALLEAGAEVDARDPEGQTPLAVAVFSSSNGVSPAVVSELLKAGAKVQDAIDRDGASLIHSVVAYREGPALVELLLPHVQDVNACDSEGRSLMHAAISLPSALLRLAAAGADVNACDQDGKTPLHLAVEWGKTDAVRALLQAGAAVNCRTQDSWRRETPLHLSVRPGRGDCVRLLVAAGARVYLQDARGRTPLHKLEGDVDPEVIACLLEAGADLEALDVDGFTPLLACIHGREFKAASALMAFGPNVQAQSSLGWGALHWLGAHEGYSEDAELEAICDLIRVLSAEGVDPNGQSNRGERPLMTAARGNRPTICSALIACGASVDATDGSGNSALHEAASANAAEALEVLLAAGGNPSARNHVGATPADLAREGDCQEALALLMRVCS